MKTFTNTLLLAFGLLVSTLSMAQNLNRLELPVPRSNEGYHTISLGNQGVVLVSQTGKTTFLIQKLNADLKQDWQVAGKIEDNLQFVKSSFDGQSVYLLFTRQRSDYYQVVKVGVTLGVSETFYLSSVNNFQITDFQTIGYSVFMAGTVRNEPSLIYTNLFTKQSKILPGTNQPNTVIQSVEVDTAKRLVNVCYALRRSKEVKLLAKTYSEDAQLIGQVMIEPEPDYSLLTGRLFVMDDSTKLMIGTYGFRSMQGGSTGSATQGLFLSKIQNDEIAFTQYHSFTDFQNFFNFMSERSKERMEKRIDRKKEKGDELRLNYRLLVHDIIQQGNNYLVSADVFYPDYKNNNYGPYGSPLSSSALYSPFYSPILMPFGYGRYFYNPWYYDPFSSYNRNNGQVFNGFVYTHAIAASFDAKGKMLWDNCLPFENVRSMELKEKMKVRANGDETVSMFYSNKGAINAKVFAQNKTLADLQPIPIQTEDNRERVRNTDADEVMHWFGSYYLATGYQQVVGADGRRNVFYLNKVSY